MLKVAVLLAMMFALVHHQYPDYAQSAQTAIKAEMSHFFPTARH
jgi:hypothetical protein